MAPGRSNPVLMIWIIAGGRDYRARPDDVERLDALKARLGVTEVVSGACGAIGEHALAKGADGFGEYWAKTWLLPVRRFYADWKKHGLPAGPIRNREMAAYVAANPHGCCILFPGGDGTADMAEAARAAGIKIIRKREE